MIIIKTPYRISLCGGSTDWPMWFKDRPGAVISFALDKYCWIICRSLPPFFTHKSRFVYSRVEEVNSISEIVHPSIRACLKFLGQETSRLDVHHVGDVPAKTGLGTSAAFTVGFLHGVHSLKGDLVSKRQLALEAMEVDQDLVGEATGCQDHVAAAYGGFNHIQFHKDRNGFSVIPLPMGPEYLRTLQNGLMLFFTGMERYANNVETAKMANWEEKIPILTKTYQLIDPMLSALSHKDMKQLGAILQTSWELKKELSELVTNNKIDEYFRAALDAGAIGGKLTGAGSGGIMLLAVPPEKRDRVKQALNRLVEIPIGFDFSGSQLLHWDPENVEDKYGTYQ